MQNLSNNCSKTLTIISKYLTISIFVLPLFCFSQEIKKADLKVLYSKTIESIKNNDSVLFQRLWEYPDSIANTCGDYPYNLFHEDALLRHFREVKANWTPFLNVITFYDVDIEQMTGQEVEEFGQQIFYWVSIDKKKDKIFPIAASVVFHKNRLVYCLSCRLPDKVVYDN